MSVHGGWKPWYKSVTTNDKLQEAVAQAKQDEYNLKQHVANVEPVLPCAEDRTTAGPTSPRQRRDHENGTGAARGAYSDRDNDTEQWDMSATSC